MKETDNKADSRMDNSKTGKTGSREAEYILALADEIIGGRRLTRDDDVSFLVNGALDAIKEGADRIRKHYCGNKVDLCTIINGRAGRCSENCKTALAHSYPLEDPLHAGQGHIVIAIDVKAV